MSNLLAKFSLICWGFVLSFVAFLIVMSVIPASIIWLVSAIIGFLILVLLGYNLWKIHLREGFDLGWFLTVKKGYWRMLLGVFGVALFLVGLLGITFPQVTDDFAEKYVMTFAKVLAILFWVALTSTFLSWSLICFSETTVHWRIGKAKSGLASFGVGFLWLLFAVLFLSLFLELINDVFFTLSSTTQNYIVSVFRRFDHNYWFVERKIRRFEKNYSQRKRHLS